MLVSVRGMNWQEAPLAFFTVFLDDSGTSPSHHVASATALIMPAGRVLRLESERANLKFKFGFTDFHTSEFVARNPMSDFANWPDAKTEHLWRRVREVAKKYVFQIVSFSVNKAEYESVLPQDFRQYKGISHYSWAMRHVLPLLQFWRYEHHIAEPYEFVFDWMERRDPARREVEDVLGQAEGVAREDRGVQGDYLNYSFRQRKLVAGLQLADAIAWTNYQMALEKYRNKPPNPFAQIAWDDFERVPSPTIPLNGQRVEWNLSVVIKGGHRKSRTERHRSFSAMERAQKLG